jgi:hypothetical protein
VRAHWLKGIGHARGSRPEAWLAEREAIGEPTDRVRHTSNPARWPWSIAVEPLLVIPHMENAPPVEAIGVAARSMSQQSHIRLGQEHYERAVEAIAGVAL